MAFALRVAEEEKWEKKKSKYSERKRGKKTKGLLDHIGTGLNIALTLRTLQWSISGLKYALKYAREKQMAKHKNKKGDDKLTRIKYWHIY